LAQQILVRLNNYKLIIQYDGTNYAGWQIQNNAVTIQQKITDAIEVITKEKVNLIGSGRTDSGVHAFGQVANFKTELDLEISKFAYSLNSILPSDISIKNIEHVAESFHARFDAKSRSYIYLFTNGKSPFYYKYSWRNQNVQSFEFDKLNALSQVLMGEHDFTSFSRKNSDVENKICSISEVWWRKGKDISVFYITANRFLHGMVRTILGTLLAAAEKKYDENYLRAVLNKKDREEADESVPARGLFLFKVRY
jgi:tRNA pseudouridine38-40 synthase